MKKNIARLTTLALLLASGAALANWGLPFSGGRYALVDIKTNETVGEVSIENGKVYEPCTCAEIDCCDEP